MKYAQLYKKLFFKTAITVALVLSFLQPLSVFALGEQPGNLSTDDRNFCSNIEGAYMTFGSAGSNELSFDTILYQETNSKRLFYLNGETEVDLPGTEPFYSFRIKVKQDYLDQLFSNLNVTGAELTTDFPGRNISNDQQSFIQNDSNSARAFTLARQIYDFTAMKSLYDDHPVDMLNSKAKFGDTFNNGYYQVKLKYTFNRSTVSFNCPIRFVVSPPIIKQYCDVTLNETGAGPVQSRQISEGSTEYVFPIKNNSNYTLTFSEIDSNTLVTDKVPKCDWTGICTATSLILSTETEELSRCQDVTSGGNFIENCNVKDSSSSDFEMFSFEFGPGKKQFNATQEGIQYVLSLTDAGGFPKCRNVRLVAGLSDIESQYEAVPTGAPDRALSAADEEAYTGVNKSNEQLAITNTIDLCETVPPDADCGGGRGSCVQKCLSCTSHFTANDQSNYDQLLALQDEGSLSATQQTQLETLQQKSKGLSSTHIWTGLGCFPTDITGLISTIFTVLIGILGGFILLCIIVEGMRIMTSAGNPEAMKKAQEGITSCIIGFIVVFFSVLILRIIGVDILQLPWFGK